MELMYPAVIIICLILALLICFTVGRKKNYTQGKKIANTKYIKETEYYKLKIRRYKILSYIIKGLNIMCIIFVSILIARPITVESKSEDKYNRDIIISLDVSTSECEVNSELISQFEEIIPNINGDRIGIVIYNTAPIVYCPLTDDYDYVNECLNKIKEQMDIVVKNNGSVPHVSTLEEEGQEIYAFWNGGTVANAEVRGSSLVGDGLARHTIFISRFKDE